MLARLLVLLAALAPCEALVVGAARLAPSHSLAARAPLRNVRLEVPPPPPSKLGATVDQDGKSNVWAVEPAVKVEKTDKGIMAYAPVAGIALLAVAAVPLLPILFASNPDQA